MRPLLAEVSHNRPAWSGYMLPIVPGGRPSVAVKTVIRSSRYRTRRVAKPIQTLPAGSSPNDRGKPSSGGDTASFVKLRSVLLALSHIHSGSLDIEDIHIFPCESSKSRKTEPGGIPSFLVYTARGCAPVTWSNLSAGGKR